MITAKDPYKRKEIPILDSTMSYVDQGQGDPIVFLHGNPTSSYLWRNIIPHLESQGRCLAPDLIGMGDSGKPGGEYKFHAHERFLNEWFLRLSLDTAITLVVHDWGSALGFNWAMMNPGSVKAIIYMEAIVMPVQWEDWPEKARGMFEALRSPAGEEMVLKKNLFVERILPGSVIRELSQEEMDHYRKPYAGSEESRQPTLTWPREIPIAGEPGDVHRKVADYSAWMSQNEVPKFFINPDPGAILIGRQREFCRTWKNQQEITVKGIHFVQEDSPDEIGKGIVDFLDRLQ